MSAPGSPMVEGVPRGHEAANILLVDDQPARLLTYRAILEPLGHNLVAVNSGLEALEALMKQDFAVVLLDVKMPGMDGFETAALIHDHPRFESTPIIFVTGVHVTEFDRLKGYKAGAIDYVYIPVVPEILRSKVAVLIELDRQRRALQSVNKQLEQSNRQLEEANFTLKSEKTRELEELNEQLRRANEDLSRINTSLATEVRERTRAEGQLKEAVVKRDEFLAMLSHELRNPLSPLRNAAHMLMQGDTQDPKIIWSRGVIERQLKHMIRLVDDLLDVSRIARGKIVVVSERVAVADVIAAAVETVQPLLEQKGQQLTVAAVDPALVVKGDPVRLAQVVGNLLHNAAKYTGEGGRIALAARSNEGRAEIIVRDSGIGISAESMPQIFELFTQIPSERVNTGAASASASRWCGRWSSCTAARSMRPAKAWTAAANSLCVCRCSSMKSWLPTRWIASPVASPSCRSVGTSSSPTTIRMRSKAWLSCSGSKATRCTALPMVKRRWRWPVSGDPRSWCSTWACPSSMVARWLAASAPRAGAVRRCWWRSPAGDRMPTASVRAKRDSTCTW